MKAAWTLVAAPRWFMVLATATVAIALMAALAYAFGTLTVRPLDGVEGEALYEASRLRAFLPLYTDPAVGTFDAGPVPTRFFVLYPPLWPALLSLVSQAWAPFAGRIVACAAWFGVLAFIASRASPQRRRTALGAAAFAGGIYTLALFGSAARPDALAVALAGAALWRTVTKGTADTVCGVAFALAAWTKPNVLGIAVGTFVALLCVDKRGLARALAGALAVSVVVAGTLQVVSRGVWLEHLARSTVQPPSLSVWREQALWRFQFYAAPLGLALWATWRSRADRRARIALGALAASLVWTLVSLAKIGAAANYWMEPAVAAVVVASEVPIPLPRGLWGARAFSAGVLLQALWTGVGSVRSSLEAIGDARARGAFVATARSVCGARPGDIVLADEPGLELMLNGRIIGTPFQMTHLARDGRYAVGPWLADVERPEVHCLLLEDDLIDRPRGQTNVEHDRFPPELVEALRARFVRISERAGFRLYRAIDR